METSFKEQRIRKITNLYYSRPDVQKAILEFSKNREISPRYFEGFGKRPDILEYTGDVLAMAKKGATSFHCSEEIWEDPLKIETGMLGKQLNELRIGWDLLLDIDCKWFDYSKLAAQAIIKVLNSHGIKNLGIKFSGSKGFHILVPWKAFPKQIGNELTKNLFPEIPRVLIDYIRDQSRKEMEKILPENFQEQFKDAKIKKGIRCLDCNEIANTSIQVDLYCNFCKIGETKKVNDPTIIFKCPNCKRDLVERKRIVVHECNKCNSTSDPNKILAGVKRGNFREVIETDLFDLMGLDLILVSPRHLFRMPYSLHEKTALSSIVLNPEKVHEFELKDADPSKIEIRNFMPDCKEGEANELVMQALDWHRTNKIDRGEVDEKIKGKYADFKPITLKNIQNEQFPPSIQELLKGISDGKKRAVFILINFFRSIGMEKSDMEKRLFEWNKKNEVPLKEGYIITQLSWAYKKKPIMPPNFTSDIYKGIGLKITPEEIKSKNPVTYTIKKNLSKIKKKKS